MADEKLTRVKAEEIREQIARRAPEAVAEAQQRYDETTAEDIRRHLREEGYDPHAEIPADARLSVPVKLVREKLRMTQAEPGGAVAYPGRHAA